MSSCLLFTSQCLIWIQPLTSQIDSSQSDSTFKFDVIYSQRFVKQWGWKGFTFSFFSWIWRVEDVKTHTLTHTPFFKPWPPADWFTPFMSLTRAAACWWHHSNSVTRMILIHTFGAELHFCQQTKLFMRVNLCPYIHSSVCEFTKWLFNI